MRFFVYEEVMNGSESVLDQLDAILLRAEEKIHDLLIPDADLLEKTAWYRSCRSTRKKMLEELALTSIYKISGSNGPHQKSYGLREEKSVEIGRNLAYTPLQILVENAESDNALILSAIKVYGSEETKDLCFGQPSRAVPPPLQFKNAGGEGEIIKIINNILETAPKNDFPPRIVVVSDGDGEWPGDLKKHAIAIREKCKENNIPCPPLNKRSAENYIPDRVWQEVYKKEAEQDEKDLAYRALASLSNEQRDYMKMAHSHTTPWDINKPQVAELFKDVPTAVEQVLKNANLKGKGVEMRIHSLIKYQNLLTREVFNSRDQNQDLLNVVKNIENEL